MDLSAYPVTGVTNKGDKEIFVTFARLPPSAPACQQSGRRSPRCGRRETAVPLSVPRPGSDACGPGAHGRVRSTTGSQTGKGAGSGRSLEPEAPPACPSQTPCPRRRVFRVVLLLLRQKGAGGPDTLSPPPGFPGLSRGITSTMAPASPSGPGSVGRAVVQGSRKARRSLPVPDPEPDAPSFRTCPGCAGIRTIDTAETVKTIKDFFECFGR